MIILGNPIYIRRWIVPASVGGLSGQLLLDDVREFARGRVGHAVTDAIAPSTSQPGRFSVNLRWIDSTRLTISRQDLEDLIQRSDDVANGQG